MNTWLPFVLVLALLPDVVEGQRDQAKDANRAAVGVVTTHARGLHGYISYSTSRPPARASRN